MMWADKQASVNRYHIAFGDRPTLPITLCRLSDPDCLSASFVIPTALYL